MGKPDLGAFAFNKRGWKITKKQPSYFENFDKIFRKKKTVAYVCKGNCIDECGDNCKCQEEKLRDMYRG